MKKTLKISFLSCSALALIACGGSLDSINSKVAEDAVKQYEMVKKTGTPAEIYVHASMVTAAYLQAKDDANYKKWHEIQLKAAKKAGM